MFDTNTVPNTSPTPTRTTVTLLFKVERGGVMRQLKHAMARIAKYIPGQGPCYRDKW